ncbi:hypothetical protein AFSV47Ss_0064 [African swine fever virus]|uniref:Uncharacterized protein n=1 Tax=African swine fever virus TaxID=10497 RepID=A0A6G6AGD8_ASF|nr:hypothetical protein AFSV47Ss_0064 [African swine fever virus]
MPKASINTKNYRTYGKKAWLLPAIRHLKMVINSLSKEVRKKRTLKIKGVKLYNGVGRHSKWNTCFQKGR